MTPSNMPRPYITGAHPQTGVLHPAGGHAERVALVAEARNLEAVDLVEQMLTAQASRPEELRNQEVVDLCLDLRNALTPRPPS